MPKVPNPDLYDQYDFKQSGSTVAVLLDITQTISVLLEANKYVRCLLKDLTKALKALIMPH